MFIKYHNINNLKAAHWSMLTLLKQSVQSGS